MNYEDVYDYCNELQYRAVTDALFYLELGDKQMFQRLAALAQESLSMMRLCLQATEQEMVN